LPLIFTLLSLTQVIGKHSHQLIADKQHSPVSRGAAARAGRGG